VAFAAKEVEHHINMGAGKFTARHMHSRFFGQDIKIEAHSIPSQQDKALAHAIRQLFNKGATFFTAHLGQGHAHPILAVTNGGLDAILSTPSEAITTNAEWTVGAPIFAFRDEASRFKVKGEIIHGRASGGDGSWMVDRPGKWSLWLAQLCFAGLRTADRL
jgi:hypothetical protein